MLNILLDTCTFLWLLQDSPSLSSASKKLFLDTENQIYLSAISEWEILVKVKLGRLKLPAPVGQFILEQRQLHGITALSLDEAAVLQLQHLPDAHRDPFDRMLVCQAITHGMAILTPDAEIRCYPVTTIW